MMPVSMLTLATATAVLTAQLSLIEVGQHESLCAEFLCWLLVLAWFDVVPRLFKGKWKGAAVVRSRPLNWLPWIAATCIAVTAFSSSIAYAYWIFPMVTLGLFALRLETAFLPRFSQWSLEHSQLLGVQVGGTLTVAFILAWGLPLDIGSIVFPLVTAIGLIGLYATLIKAFELDLYLPGSGVELGLGEIGRAIAIRATFMLSALALAVSVLVPAPILDKTSVAVIGVAKAAHWVVIFWMAQEAPWEVATTIWTFATSSTEALTSLTVNVSLSHSVVGFLALYQTVSLLPKRTQGRYLLLIFGLWPIIPLLAPAGTWLDGITRVKGLRNNFHPIENLVVNAQADFTKLIDRQSRTIADAEAEYRRRYSRNPPPGFEKWFHYAQAKNSVLIDDFDMINEDLKPFWKISPQRLLESVDYVTSSKDNAMGLVKVEIRNGTYHANGAGWLIDGLGDIAAEMPEDVPDLAVAFNVIDEPRVVLSQAVLDAGGVAKPEFQDEGHKSIWKHVTDPCGVRSRSYRMGPVHDYGIPFVQSNLDMRDTCRHPEWASQHGFFASPSTARLTDAPIPILSQAAPSTFGDIISPSTWQVARYWGGRYKDSEDPPWEQKTNNLYWAGSTTGSHSTNNSWKFGHRQRMVQLVQTLNETSHKYLEEVNQGVWKPHMAVEDVQDLFDVKFTGIIQCDEKDCEEEKQFFDIGERAELGKTFDSRFVFDTDGNMWSGRYYTLLGSRSAVLKQTAFKEWHDERLVPWVHYIPVSLSMEELPETMRYMTGNEKGQQRAEEIANAGREWKEKALRDEDCTIYLYRLMLELARIMDPNREVE